MDMYIICAIAVVLSLFTKGFTGFRMERIRADLVRDKREAQDLKSHLADSRKRHAELQRMCRSKEVRIGKLKKEISLIEQRIKP